MAAYGVPAYRVTSSTGAKLENYLPQTYSQFLIDEKARQSGLFSSIPILLIVLIGGFLLLKKLR